MSPKPWGGKVVEIRIDISRFYIAIYLFEIVFIIFGAQTRVLAWKEKKACVGFCSGHGDCGNCPKKQGNCCELVISRLLVYNDKKLGQEW